MLARQRELSQTELQVASGKRMLHPSDDPRRRCAYWTSKESQQRLGQYQRNADAAYAKLDQEETALLSIENLLQRVRELAVQGVNDTPERRGPQCRRRRGARTHGELPAARQLGGFER